MVYNWQQPDWLSFQVEEERFDEKWQTFLSLSGKSIGFFESLSSAKKEESIINLLVKEALKTSEIEGELISRVDVISSIKKRLGYQIDFQTRDKRSEGIAELLVEVRENFDKDISEKMLFRWHQLLMRGNYMVKVGEWRTHTEPMQVVSGAMGKEKVHFEAPPSNQVPNEMKQFIKWFNKKSVKNGLIRASITHLYFETIHPFEDGNGRIGRVLAEKALSQSINRPILMSLSQTIERDKKNYYAHLEKAQRTNNVTVWTDYFSNLIIASQEEFISTIQFSIKKAHFFDENKPKFNERQLKVIERILRDDDFEGKMNARKYQVIAKTSKATATRDLTDLVEKNIFLVSGLGRNTSYELNL